jgi:peptidoglycan/xylan/chitin deacetylase (PgdA/CDA1 family)
VYPDALHDLAAAGHEIGYHGWRHEHWPRIDSRELEAELILRGTRKMAKHGITVRGFRPPRRAGSGPGCADRDRPVHLLLVPVLSVRQRDLARLRRSSVRIAGRWVLA